MAGSRPPLPSVRPFFQWTVEQDSGALQGPDPLFSSSCSRKAKTSSLTLAMSPRQNSSILNTFMSLHVLTEFGGGGYKSSGWDWQSCPRCLGPTRSGCKVAIYAAAPGREGSTDLEIMTLPPLLRFTLTMSPHDPVFSFVLAGVSQAPMVLPCRVVIFKAGQSNPHERGDYSSRGQKGGCLYAKTTVGINPTC